MLLKEVIERELDNMIEEGQFNEADFHSIMGKVKDFVTRKDSKTKKRFNELLGSAFEGEFGQYLTKTLNSNMSKVDVINIISNYIKGSQNSDAAFEIIGIPMLNYFVEKTFGRSSMKDRLRQMTPFMKKVSTGNSQLDYYIFSTFDKVLESKKVRKMFRDKLRITIDNKLHGLLNNDEFESLVSNAPTNEGTELIDEANVVTNTARSVRNMFRSREVRNKFKLLDDILDNMPKLNSQIKRSIKNRLMDLDYDVIYDVKNLKNINKVAKIVTLPILQYIIKNSQDIYFKEGYFGQLVELIKDVFLDKEVVKHIEEGVKEYFKQSVLKTREIEQKQKK